jgi:hypothetical protein
MLARSRQPRYCRSSYLPFGSGLGLGAGGDNPHRAGLMKVTLRASTGARVVVWREGDFFCARPADGAADPEVCLAVDLFEVLADLTGLDLERQEHVAEAVALSEEAQRRLRPSARGAEARPAGGDDSPGEPPDAAEDPRRRSR